MEEIKDHLRDIREIRSLMEQNTKFLSLSGLSGVAAGICALIGAFAAWLYLGQHFDYIFGVGRVHRGDVNLFLAVDVLLVLVCALGSAAFFSRRLALKKGLEVWNKTALNLLWHLAIPVGAGAIFCLIQLYHGLVFWIPATMLLFYGMALLNASKFTLPEMRYLGISELVLGLACAVWFQYGLIFWAVGFGVLHIVYGLVMYYKYEQ